jgi:hypothetical protein
LNHTAGVDEWCGTVGTGATGNLDDSIDTFGWRRGAVGRRMAFATTRFLFTFLEFETAKGGGLAIRFSLRRREFLAETMVFPL